MNPLFNIVLVSPEIPGNTGNIGRTCVALNLRLILIHPLGFQLDQKSVRRAGLDYWRHVQLVEYESWEKFEKKENPAENKFFLLTKTAPTLHYEGNYTEGCYLILGSETCGLPPGLLERYHSRRFRLPLYSEHVRSLNLGNAACAVTYEALRQIKGL